MFVLLGPARAGERRLCSAVLVEKQCPLPIWANYIKAQALLCRNISQIKLSNSELLYSPAVVLGV